MLTASRLLSTKYLCSWTLMYNGEVHKLFSLIRGDLQIEMADHDFVVSLSAFPTSDWKILFQIANRHGVGAIAYDGLKECR